MRAIILVLILWPSQAVRAQEAKPASIEIFNGHGSLRAFYDAQAGLYAADLPSGARYLSSHDFSYGNPFIIVDRKKNPPEVLFRMNFEDANRRVDYWAVGQGERLVGLEQTGQAKIQHSRCPDEDRATPVVVRNAYRGADGDGNVFEVVEIIPYPKPACREDRLRYDIRMTPAKSGAAAARPRLESFVEDFRSSLRGLFELSPADYDLSRDIAPSPTF